MNKAEKLADLRHSLRRYGLPPERPALSLGMDALDAMLGGGLVPGALHEVHAADWGAAGFAACLALRAAGDKPLFWVRPDYEALEYGEVSPLGLLELGGRPDRLIRLCPPNVTEALAASADILSCAPVGALVLEVTDNPKSLDLVASRRLSFAAAESGVTLVMLREGAVESASAALTRWRVESRSSQPGDEWGLPTFHAELLRHRQGGTGAWTLQWDPDHGRFREPSRQQHAPHPLAMAAAPSHRPADPAFARTG
jgi:protein ImuA